MTVSVAALVYAMVLWINSTGLIEPVIPDRPVAVNVTDRAGIVQDINRCYAVKGLPQPDQEAVRKYAETLNGLYCEDRITITDEMDLNTIQGQTVLVHELVHWLQDYNGEAEAAPCVAHLEKNAYAVHQWWQAATGQPITPDPFTILVRSQCR